MQDNKTWLKEKIDKKQPIICSSCNKESTLIEHLQKYYASTQGKILCNPCVEKLHDRLIDKYTN